MALIKINSTVVRLLWRMDVVVFLLVVVACLLVDGNGCLPGLNSSASSAIAFFLFGTAFVLNAAIAIGEPSLVRRLVACLILVAVALLAYPAIFG